MGGEWEILFIDNVCDRLPVCDVMSVLQGVGAILNLATPIHCPASPCSLLMLSYLLILAGLVTVAGCQHRVV